MCADLPPAASQAALGVSESAAKPQDGIAGPPCDSADRLQVKAQLQDRAQHVILPADDASAKSSIHNGGPESPPVSERACVDCCTTRRSAELLNCHFLKVARVKQLIKAADYVPAYTRPFSP